MFANGEGMESFREFIRRMLRGGASAAARHRKYCEAMEGMIDFFIATTNFGNDGELFSQSYLRECARNIFYTFCANGAARRVDLSSTVLAEIEADICRSNENNQDEDIGDAQEVKSDEISSTLFDTARREILSSLEHQSKLVFAEYKQSSSFQTYLAKQRLSIKQVERPSECVLCSVKTGVHAMHPLYDQSGTSGRQLVLPASGVGFMRKERRLAWVHTLCAMVSTSSSTLIFCRFISVQSLTCNFLSLLLLFSTTEMFMKCKKVYLFK